MRIPEILHAPQAVFMNIFERSLFHHDGIHILGKFKDVIKILQFLYGILTTVYYVIFIKALLTNDDAAILLSTAKYTGGAE